MILEYDHLAGKGFVWEKQDCLTLFRDFYWDNFKIHIRNYARPIDWSSDQLDLVRLCYEREGFDMITDWKLKDLRPADVLCMAIGEANPNHFSIYVGDDRVVHHLYGRQSTVEVFRDFYRNTTCYVLRHPDVPDLRPVYPDVDIASILRDRNRSPAKRPD